MLRRIESRSRSMHLCSCFSIERGKKQESADSVFLGEPDPDKEEERKSLHSSRVARATRYLKSSSVCFSADNIYARTLHFFVKSMMEEIEKFCHLEDFFKHD